MDSNFDLNINNYTIKELESIFELPSIYDDTVIKAQENKLRQNIMNDNKTPISVKNNTLSFINLVTETLINNSKKNTTIINTSKDNSPTFTSPFSKNSFLPPNMPPSNFEAYIHHMDNSLYQSNINTSGSTPVISKPPTPFTVGYGMEFFPGTLNPLTKRILKKTLNIDTRFRDNYYTTTSSNFLVNLPAIVNQVVFMELAAIELPSSFFAISKVFGNNFFTLEIHDILPVPPLTITIPDGNYDYLSFITYVNNFLQTLPSEYSAYSKITFIADLVLSTVSSSVGGSGRMIIGSKNGNIKFSINFLTDRLGNEDRQTPLPLKLGWMLGFREGYYENSYTYVSEGLINLLGPRYFYLAIDDFNNNVADGFFGAFNSSLLNKNILARISLIGASISASTVNISAFNGNLVAAPRHYFGPVNITKLQIQVIDEYGRILDFNNMDFSFVLYFLTVYDL
jgi:hypothetical protein